MRPSVRGLLLDDDEHLVIFRRTVPGRAVYWSVPGGHVEPGDATLEHTLRRELLEELGATVSAVTPLTTVSYPWEGGVKTQHVYGCRLVAMDPALRHGPELDDPGRGVYEVERLPLEREEITSRHVVPEAVAAYLSGHIEALPRLIEDRPPAGAAVSDGPRSPTDGR
ncbi:MULTISPECIES: NUDIX domain-containing protein [Nonomuraea]|jgi:8-oxo-dGTP pyrophosphatase MutT (NUDIX family)|uniref:NUDIX hydrolase n=1 Tax=Nonomuraea ferruginea TaxID=46174 RepID=A0ABT4SWQ4_9ACTN|nr:MULTISPECIES: NUDIX hydrolase [Nonomuraea]MDA0641679.1 NUDIX hydrolase [Nonomuraea ferruginea]TXK41697.1 NUDIX hydrolase [Nonomuraea sp. C10]